MYVVLLIKQGRKRPLDTPKRIIERWERERKVEGRYREGGRDKRDRERGGERDRESERELVLSKPNPSPNAFHKLCEWFSGRFLLKGKG